MCNEDYQRESLALLKRLVALQESGDPIDQYYAISATKGFFLDFKRRRHLYMFTPTAITLLLPDTGGTLLVAANTWTEISHRPGLQLFTSSAQTADVQVLVRASDETIDAIQQVGGTVTANQGGAWTVAATQGTSPWQNNIQQIGGVATQMASGDGENPLNVLEVGLGIYSSGGPNDATGKSQSLSFDRLRSFQGKGVGGANANITATLAGDTSLVFAVAPKTIVPGQLIQVSTNGSGTVEYVKVAETYAISSTTTTIPLQTAIVNAGNQTAKWDIFGQSGPGGGSVLPTGLVVSAMALQAGGGGNTVTVASNANADGVTANQFQEVVPGFYNGTTVDRARIPNIFKTATATALGDTAVWTPAGGKKFRLMRYIIYLTANASLAVAGLEEIILRDATTGLAFAFSAFVPGAAGTTFVDDTDSSWIMLGNGYLSTTVNNVLNVNLSVALATGEVRVVAIGTEE